jgi:hypothetical protein
MARTDTTPFRDPRNAVGLLTDVLDLALAGPTLTTSALKDNAVFEAVIEARNVGREFTKASRRVLNGAFRRNTAGLYQRTKTAREHVPEGSWLMRDTKLRELYATVGALSDRSLQIIEKVMEDAEVWNQPGTRGRDPVIQAWHQSWHDHVSSALRLGVDLATILNLECGWRFRDLTDRSHRGRNVRAAFEAAWLAGQYKFAQQLVTEALR